MEYYSTIKKEWNSDSCYNVDEPWKHYAIWKKKKKTYQRDFCSSSVVDSMLPLHGAQVRSLVRDLRSYGQKKKKNTHTHMSSLSIHSLMDTCLSLLVIVNNAAINVRVQKTSIVWLYLYEAPRKGKFIETRDGIQSPEAKGERNGEFLFIGYRVSLRNDKGGSGNEKWGWLHNIVHVLNAT